MIADQQKILDFLGLGIPRTVRAISKYLDGKPSENVRSNLNTLKKRKLIEEFSYDDIGGINNDSKTKPPKYWGLYGKYLKDKRIEVLEKENTRLKKILKENNLDFV